MIQFPFFVCEGCCGSARAAISDGVYVMAVGASCEVHADEFVLLVFGKPEKELDLSCELA